MKYVFLIFCVIQFIVLPIHRTCAQTSENLVLQLAKANNDTLKIDILSKLADAYTRSDMTVCLDYAKEMVQLLNRQPATDQNAARYADAAIIYLNCNVYDKALELLLKALNIFEKSGNQSSIAIIKNSMGSVYFRINNNELALKYFQEGLKDCESLIEQGDSTHFGNLHNFYNNIGLIYYQMDEKKILAGNYFEKAIEKTNPRDYNSLGQYYNNIASYYYWNNKKSLAFDCALKSLEYRKKINNGNGIAMTSYTLASLYYGENDMVNAQRYLDTAMYIGEQLKSNLLLKNVLDLRIRIAEKEKDFNKAYTSLRQVREIEHSLINDTLLARTTTMKIEYDYAQRTALQQLELQQAHAKIRLISYILVLVVLLLILLYFLIRNRNQRIQLEKEKLKKDLEVRNKELTTNVMYLMRYTDMVREIIQRLIQIRPNLKVENAETVKKVIVDLQALIKEDLWDEFEIHFNRVHLDFYKNLKENSPDITPTELKLCAFLRLNMSSKEISSITGITVKSVEVMRTRLRKKLNIANTDINLISYLSDF